MQHNKYSNSTPIQLKNNILLRTFFALGGNRALTSKPAAGVCVVDGMAV